MNNAIIGTGNATFATGATNPDGTPVMAVAPNIFVQRYLSIIDQYGASTTLGLWGNNYLEANLGYLKSAGSADRPGGTLRFVFPFNSHLAFTAEGSINQTLVGPSNNGRAVFGVQFGNYLRPKDYQGQTQAVPADIPRSAIQRPVAQSSCGNIAAGGRCRPGSNRSAGRPHHAEWLELA